jgi:hypothetical protein
MTVSLRRLGPNGALLALVVLGASLALATAAVSKPAKHHLTSSKITLGRSIGNIEIGMRIPQVAKYHGSPAPGNSHSTARTTFSVYGPVSRPEFTVLFTGKSRRASAIGETNAALRTAAGISIGSSLGQVEAAYPALECETSVKEAEPNNARGNCDLPGPSGRATRFSFSEGEVGVIGVAEKAWLSKLH